MKPEWSKFKNREDFLGGLAIALSEEYGLINAENMCKKMAGRISAWRWQDKKDKQFRLKQIMIYRNCYIRQLLATQTGLTAYGIPQSLTELKKLNLTIKRTIERIKNGQYRKGQEITI
jgi:hypothetical protein